MANRNCLHHGGATAHRHFPKAQSPCGELTLATATSHSGYEALLPGRRGKTTTATFHYQLHHRYSTCTYDIVELPMDRWFGSFNDGSTAATRRFLRQAR